MSYDIAQVCPNGHVANSSYQEFPEYNREFCEHCGEKTITHCPNCNNPILGYPRDIVAIGYKYRPPAYCHRCGHAFPWTERKIQAAVELSAEEAHLNDEDRAILEQSINDIVKDSPKTQLAASRFKKAMTKAGTATAGAVKDILVDIVSETAKKIIWPSG
jgi:hypothetical protein